MNILVFGCGAIGSAFGGFLSRTKHRITLYGRPWHLRAIARSGLRVSGIWGKYNFKQFRLFSDLTRLRKARIPFALVLFTVKSFDTKRACSDLRKVTTPNSVIVSLQNGLGNIEELLRHFDASQVLAGRVIFGVEIAPGKIKITVTADDVRLGETSYRRLSPRVRSIAALFTQAGIKTKPTSDVRRYLWAKVLYNCALNPLASLLGTHYGALLENSYTRDLMKEIVRETYRVAGRQRIALVSKTHEGYIRLLFNKLIPATYHHHPSMLQDFARGRSTEIDSLNNSIAQMGKKLGIATPTNQFVTALVKAKESCCSQD
uniref:2-dehydropantoate 2-reductase n=1 Tax=uncultured bacterium W4-21b TaxID=1130993 RepID=H9BWM4_9BACT|nr:2-dehydropantoate 2-reductase [uncultured bacterium W4-21b]